MPTRAYRVAYDGRPFHGFQRQPSVPTVEGALFDALSALDVLDDPTSGGTDPEGDQTSDDFDEDFGDDFGDDFEDFGDDFEDFGDDFEDFGDDFEDFGGDFASDASGGDASGGNASGGAEPGAASAGAAPPGYAAAGRTDAGVSALAQTVAFEAPAWLSPSALNGELPASVRAWARADAPDGFHATRDAASRAYVYYLHAPDADPWRARSALSQLEGTHDFHNLTAADADTTRTVQEATADPDGDYLVVRLRADGFLHEMVRRVATLVRSVLDGEADLDRVDRVLSPEALSGPDGVAPAPAYPLVLVDVEYPDLSFDVDRSAADGAREAFEDLRVERTTGARVADEVAGGIGGGSVDADDDLSLF